MKINTLNNVVLKVEMSKVLTLRLKLFMLLIRLACWVGSVGVEFVSAEPPNTVLQSDGLHGCPRCMFVMTRRGVCPRCGYDTTRR
jgi:hypothetical protein